MEVINYHKGLNIGLCKNEKGKIYKIYKINVKKDFKYLVVGEKVKGTCKFTNTGERILIDVEPFDEDYECVKKPIYDYIQ